MREWTTAHILDLIPQVAKEHNIEVTGENKFLKNNNLMVNAATCSGYMKLLTPADSDNPPLGLYMELKREPNGTQPYWATPYNAAKRPVWTKIQLTMNTLTTFTDRRLVTYAIIPDTIFDFGIVYKNNNNWKGYEIPSWKDLHFPHSSTFRTPSGVIELEATSVTVEYTPSGNIPCNGGTVELPCYAVYLTPTFPSTVFTLSDTVEGILEL